LVTPVAGNVLCFISFLARRLHLFPVFYSSSLLFSHLADGTVCRKDFDEADILAKGPFLPRTVEDSLRQGYH